MKQSLTFKEAKEQIDMVDYLISLGHHPAKNPRRDEYWFHSPLNPGGDSTPSFKVIKNNHGIFIWYDHSQGFGGDLITFCEKYHSCSKKEALEKCMDFLRLPRQESFIKPIKRYEKKDKNEDTSERKIEVVAVRPIEKYYLKSYLQERCIPLDLAKQYLKEVHYTNGIAGKEQKIFTALGFKNDLGGFELRSKNFKASSAPKGPTFLTNLTEDEMKNKARHEQSIAVYEGFFSFLSFQRLWFHNKLDTPLPDNFYILNSLAFFSINFDFMDGFWQKMLFLDNDSRGRSATKEAVKRDKTYIDYGNVFASHKDLNQLLISYYNPEYGQNRGLAMRM